MCFNSRSREGSDYAFVQIFDSQFCFNSRSREGSDVVLGSLVSEGLIVSIHAPARGATVWILIIAQFLTFQFTLPRGERLSRQKYN